MLRYITNLPNMFTSASIFCGFLSIILSASASTGDRENLYQAAIAIVFATIFDGLDGRVARLTKTASDFGIQYDSLADVVSFGVAPAVLVYAWGLAFYGGLGMAVAFAFVVAGAMRLARFNITTKVLPKQWSLGLTITEAGGTLAMIVIIFHRSGGEEVSNHPSVLITVAVLAYLMISNIRFRTFKGLKLTRRSTVGILIGVGLALLVMVIYRDFTFVLLYALVAHIGTGLIEEVVFYRQRREAEAKALEDEEASYEQALPPHADDLTSRPA